MKTVSIAQAKDSFTELLRAVEAGQAVRITRRGSAVAVIVSDAEYDRMLRSAQLADFARWAQAWREALPAGFVGITVDESERWRDG